MNKLVRMANVELRDFEEDGRVEGIAAVFNTPTDLGWFTEEIDRHAFDFADMSDVVLNFNHNDDYLLAGTRNGSLQLQVRDDGLFQTSHIVDTSQGRDVKKLIREGLISKMSFAFVIDEDGGEEWVRNGDKEHRIIRKISKLFDVSLVTFPAYPTTSAWARSQSDELADKHKALMERRAEQDRRMAELFKKIES